MCHQQHKMKYLTQTDFYTKIMREANKDSVIVLNVGILINIKKCCYTIINAFDYTTLLTFEFITNGEHAKKWEISYYKKKYYCEKRRLLSTIESILGKQLSINI